MSLPFKVEDCMVRKLVTVSPETDAYEAIDCLLRHRISGMPVVDDSGRLVGVLSERDCMKTLSNAQYHNLPPALVRDLMSTAMCTVPPDLGLLEVAELFVRRRHRRLPVVDADGKLVGQISRHDVLQAIQKMHASHGPPSE